MVRLSAKFDGKVFVPDEAVDMPRDQNVIIHVESVSSPSPMQARPDLPSGTPVHELLRFAGTISKEDAEEWMKAIDEDDSDDILPPGTSAEDMMKFAGLIDAADLKEMEKAIEENCEQADPDGWQIAPRYERPPRRAIPVIVSSPPPASQAPS